MSVRNQSEKKVSTVFVSTLIIYAIYFLSICVMENDWMYSNIVWFLIQSYLV